MLAFEIEYLSGVCYAADYTDRHRPEWPPHPDRFFSALLAAAYQAALGDPALAALQWLETQGAPLITASAARPRRPVTVYVPINDPPPGDALPLSRSKQPRTFPCVVPDDPSVYFVWPAATPNARQRALFDQLAANVPYLGNARSLVRVTLCNAPPPPTWRPGDSGECVLRVPGPGRVAELVQLFALARRPTPSLLHLYTRADRPGSLPPGRGTFGEMICLRQSGGPLVPLTATLTVTEALRRAVLARAGEAAPGVLHGHGAALRAPHIAWIPLPFVGHQHADGHLVGVAAVLPRGLHSTDRRSVLAAIARVDHVRLPDGRLWELRPVGSETPPRYTLQPATWTRPSRTWTTVTPVVLDRYPKPRPGQDMDAILQAACRYIDVPRPDTITVHRDGRVAGVPLSSAFRTRRHGLAQRLFTHTTVTFRDPVEGPIILGAHRHFGLGLCRPIRAREETADAG